MAYRHYTDGKTLELLKQMIGEQTGKEVIINCRQKDDLRETDIHNINLSKINMLVKEED
jgi:hypothetical protein